MGWALGRAGVRMRHLPVDNAHNFRCNCWVVLRNQFCCGVHPVCYNGPAVRKASLPIHKRCRFVCECCSNGCSNAAGITGASSGAFGRCFRYNSSMVKGLHNEQPSKQRRGQKPRPTTLGWMAAHLDLPSVKKKETIRNNFHNENVCYDRKKKGTTASADNCIAYLRSWN